MVLMKIYADHRKKYLQKIFRHLEHLFESGEKSFSIWNELNYAL